MIGYFINYILFYKLYFILSIIYSYALIITLHDFNTHYVDQRSNKYFYVNKKTKRRQWNDPRDYVLHFQKDNIGLLQCFLQQNFNIISQVNQGHCQLGGTLDMTPGISGTITSIRI